MLRSYPFSVSLSLLLFCLLNKEKANTNGATRSQCIILGEAAAILKVNFTPALRLVSGAAGLLQFMKALYILNLKITWVLAHSINKLGTEFHVFKGYGEREIDVLKKD